MCIVSLILIYASYFSFVYYVRHNAYIPTTAGLTLSTALKFWPRFFWKWSFFDQKQQPLNNVEPFERILRALLIAQCPYKFSSFLDLRNGSSRFRLFARDLRLFRFLFSRSACFLKVAPPENLQSWVKYHGKSESFGKEFRWTKFLEKKFGGSNIMRWRGWEAACLWFFLSFFLGFRRPNLTTGLSGWWAPD